MACIEVGEHGVHSRSVYISFNMEVGDLTIPFARLHTVSTAYMDNKGNYMQGDAKDINVKIISELRLSFDAMVNDIEYIINSGEGTAAKLENNAFQPIPVLLDNNYIIKIK